MKKEFLSALAASVIGKVIADEAKGWMEWLPGKLIRSAAKKFPEEERARMEEEWLAHCSDLPGAVAKCLHGFGCVFTSVTANKSFGDTAVRMLFCPVTELHGFFQAFAYAFASVVKFRKSERYFYGSEAWARSLRRRSGGFTVLGLSEKTVEEYNVNIKIPSLLYRLPDSNVSRVLRAQSTIAWERWSRILVPICNRLVRVFAHTYRRCVTG